MLPLLRAGLAFGSVICAVLVADTVSIAIMKIVDNATMSGDPGRRGWRREQPAVLEQPDRGAADLASVVAFPVNR